MGFLRFFRIGLFVVSAKGVTKFKEVNILVTGIIICGIILKDLPCRRVEGIFESKPSYIIFEVNYVIIKVNNVIINNAIIINRISGCVINNIIKLLNIIGKPIFLL